MASGSHRQSEAQAPAGADTQPDRFKKMIHDGVHGEKKRLIPHRATNDSKCDLLLRFQGTKPMQRSPPTPALPPRKRGGRETGLEEWEPGVSLRAPDGELRSTPSYILSPLPGRVSTRFDHRPGNRWLIADS